MKQWPWATGPVAVLMVLAGCPAGRAPGGFGPADSLAISSVQAAYVQAWLSDDTTAVLATLDSNAVLLPPGRDPVAGRARIRAFWWPEDGSHTRITGFTWDVAEILGSGNLAVARGLSTVSWTYTRDTTTTSQTVRNISLSVLERRSDGAWRITRQMWGPALP